MRIRPRGGFVRSLNRAPIYVQHALHNDLLGILARGRARVTDRRLRARIVGNWYLYFRHPEIGEENVYQPDTYVLLSVEEEK